MPPRVERGYERDIGAADKQASMLAGPCKAVSNGNQLRAVGSIDTLQPTPPFPLPASLSCVTSSPGVGDRGEWLLNAQSMSDWGGGHFRHLAANKVIRQMGTDDS